MSRVEEEQWKSRVHSEVPGSKKGKKKNYLTMAKRGLRVPWTPEVFCRGLALTTRSGARASRCKRGVSRSPGFWSWLECYLPIFSETRISLSENRFRTDDLCKLRSGWDICGCLIFERGAELHHRRCALQVIPLVCCWITL